MQPCLHITHPSSSASPAIAICAPTRCRGSAAQVDEFLADLKLRLPDTELRVMTGMAQGADLLVARAAVNAGCKVDAVLADAAGSLCSRFRHRVGRRAASALLADPAVHCTVLPAPPGADHDAKHGDEQGGVLRQPHAGAGGEVQPPARAVGWQDFAARGWDGGYGAALSRGAHSAGSRTSPLSSSRRRGSRSGVGAALRVLDSRAARQPRRGLLAASRATSPPSGKTCWPCMVGASLTHWRSSSSS